MLVLRENRETPNGISSMNPQKKSCLHRLVSARILPTYLSLNPAPIRHHSAESPQLNLHPFNLPPFSLQKAGMVSRAVCSASGCALSSRTSLAVEEAEGRGHDAGFKLVAVGLVRAGCGLEAHDAVALGQVVRRVNAEVQVGASADLKKSHTNRETHRSRT